MRLAGFAAPGSTRHLGMLAAEPAVYVPATALRMAAVFERDRPLAAIFKGGVYKPSALTLWGFQQRLR